ncbi:hypothetical protein [Ekhidna sp.]|uniref:hypothetical protein n=1 Tax=Ekhidna sp. TaxID=2608089 RepID=UPI0032EC926F
MALITLLLILGFPLTNEEGGNESRKSRAEKGLDIMESAFDRFHINYEMSRVHNFGYYKETVSKRQNDIYEAEGIVDIYIPCNLNKRLEAMISPIKTRKKIYRKVDEDKLIEGHAAEMARSSIWRGNSFLNEKERSQYQYMQVGDTLFNDRDSYIISFTPLKKFGKTKGTLFVDKESLAIVHMEYSPIFDTNKSIWKSIKWTEDFEFKEGAFVLTEVKFKGITYDGYIYNSLLKMDRLEVVSEIPEHELFLPMGASLFGNAQELDEETFWDGFTFLKPKSE